MPPAPGTISIQPEAMYLPPSKQWCWIPVHVTIRKLSQGVGECLGGTFATGGSCERSDFRRLYGSKFFSHGIPLLNNGPSFDRIHNRPWPRAQRNQRYLVL